MPMQAVVLSAPAPWYRDITREQWRVLVAAKLGWMLDAMDFMIYAMAVGRLKTYFGFDDATAGMLGTVTLAMSAIGGLIFGVVADRLGRTRSERLRYRSDRDVCHPAACRSRPVAQAFRPAGASSAERAALLLQERDRLR